MLRWHLANSSNRGSRRRTDRDEKALKEMAMAEVPDRSRDVQGMFDRIAHRYDRVNRVMTIGQDQRWRRALIELTGVGRGERTLDLGCGTGDLLALARAAGGQAVGVDFSRAMLEEARSRGMLSSLIMGDARQLPFPGGSFGSVVSAFTLRNIDPLEAALREAARVLRPGGRLGLLEVDQPRTTLLSALHRVYFRRIVPLAGGALAGDRAAYRYLPDSTRFLPGDAELGALLRRCGFEGVRKRRYGFGGIQVVVADRCP
jgi:demethylmenaquinone methyltransferase/2-methoxy-6-polyprenyl-1,4-benzoquinol methylase